MLCLYPWIVVLLSVLMYIEVLFLSISDKMHIAKSSAFVVEIVSGMAKLKSIVCGKLFHAAPAVMSINPIFFIDLSV